MTAIEHNPLLYPRPTRFMEALFWAPLAPGFVIGVFFPPALPFTLIGSLIVGAPFSFCVFAPTIMLMARRWRMTWWNVTLAGFLSVLCVGVVHCLVAGHLETGIETDLFFAACGAVAAFFFWVIAGDFGAGVSDRRRA